MIIDSHVHICGPPLNQENLKIRCRDGSVLTFPFAKRADASVDRLLQDLNANNIDKAFVCAVDGAVTNEFLSKVVKEHSGKIVGFAWIDDPLDEMKSVDALEMAVTS